MHARWCPPRAAPPCPTCPRCATACPPGSLRSPRRTTATRASCPTVVSSSSALRRAGSRSPRSCTVPGARSPSPSASTSDMPRTYRGKDILWWMDASGLLDERYDEIPDLPRARRLPSMQLVGSPDRRTVDLNALRRLGVRLVGRLAGIRDGVAQFSGSLANMSALADLKLGRLLDTFDAWAAESAVDGLGAAATIRRHRDSRARAVGSRPSLRRDPDDRLGHRIPAGSVVARCPGIRPEGPHSPRRRRDRQPRPLSASACRFCVAGSRASSTALPTTPRTSTDHLARYLASA